MTAPTSATVGGTQTASKYNEFVARLSAATSYAATLSNWTSATIAPTTTARYWRIGDTIEVLIQSKLGTGAITVGNITVSLPVAMDTTGMILDSFELTGKVALDDVSAGTTAFYGGSVRVIDANTVRIMRGSAANPGVDATITSALPFTWATLDQFSAHFFYPIP